MTTHVAHGQLHWPRASPWLLASAVVVLVAGALVGGIFIGRSTKESAAPVQRLASKQVVAAIDGWMAVTRRGDFNAFAGYLAKDVVYHEPAQGIAAMRGRKEVTALSEGYYNLGARYYRVSPVIQRGDIAAFAASCPACPSDPNDVVLLQFDEHLRIAQMWTGVTAGSG